RWGAMRVAGSRSHARRWRPAAVAYRASPVRRQAAANAGTPTLMRMSACRWATKLSGFDIPSRCTYGPSRFFGSGHQESPAAKHSCGPPARRGDRVAVIVTAGWSTNASAAARTRPRSKAARSKAGREADAAALAATADTDRERAAIIDVFRS